MKDSYPSLSLERICRLLGLTRQAYYVHNWRKDVKEEHDSLVLGQVKVLRGEHPRMGGRKLQVLLHPFLQQHAIKMGRDALFTTLAREGLLIKQRRRRMVTTHSQHWFRKYPNLTKDYQPQRPEQLWVSDITYVPCARTHLYLSLVTDVYSHKIMGYHIADTLEAVHCTTALRMALLNRTHRSSDLMHHSDRGIQYCSKEYTALLKQNQITISMTQSSDPLDNAVAERINGIVKNEYLGHYHFSTLEQAQYLLQTIVNRYNDKRPHQSIQMYTPSLVHDKQLLVNRHWRKPNKNTTIVTTNNHL